MNLYFNILRYINILLSWGYSRNYSISITTGDQSSEHSCVRAVSNQVKFEFNIFRVLPYYSISLFVKEEVIHGYRQSDA
jgi:hypothetical protein